MGKERAQGNGATTVRVMRHQARTRRGGGIPPTKHRDANGGCSAREESRFSPKRETNACAVSPVPEGATRGHGRGLAERTEAGRGELCRTRPRSRICIRRAGRRTHKSPTLHREHGRPDRDRTLEGKTAQSINRAPTQQRKAAQANTSDIFCKIKIVILQQIYYTTINQTTFQALARCLLIGARRCDGRGARKER